MAASALDDCVSKVDNLILEVGKGMDGSDVPRMKVDPDDPWADIWNPPPAVYKVRAWWWRGRGRRFSLEHDACFAPTASDGRESTAQSRIAISSYIKERSFGGKRAKRERERACATPSSRLERDTCV